MFWLHDAFLLSSRVCCVLVHHGRHRTSCKQESVCFALCRLYLVAWATTSQNQSKITRNDVGLPSTHKHTTKDVFLLREFAAYNMGDEGYYEDDGAGIDDEYYLNQMSKDSSKGKVTKRQPTEKVTITTTLSADIFFRPLK